MMKDLNLNEDQQDCLQELMNVAYGSATAAITEILNAFATLSIPSIKIINARDLKAHLLNDVDSERSQFISTQQFNGHISGENLFIIDDISAKNMALQFGLEEHEIDQEELSDIVLEITNILSSSTISKLSEDIEIPISFSPPGIEILMSMEDLNNHYLDEYEKVIIIKTELNFKDQNISGELLILTTDDSIIKIKERIDEILEEL